MKARATLLALGLLASRAPAQFPEPERAAVATTLALEVEPHRLDAAVAGEPLIIAFPQQIYESVNETAKLPNERK